MKNLLSITCLLFIITSCKTNSNCDAYSQLLKKQTDSLESQIKNKKDSINLLNNFLYNIVSDLVIQQLIISDIDIYILLIYLSSLD